MLNPQMQGGWGVGQAPNPPSNPFSNPTSTQPANPFAPPKVNPFLQGQSGGATPTPNPFLANSAQPPSSNSSMLQTLTQMANGRHDDFRMPSNMKNPFEKKNVSSAINTNGQSTASPFNLKPNPFSSPSNGQPPNTHNPFSTPTTSSAEVRPSPFSQQDSTPKLESFGRPSFTQTSKPTTTSDGSSSKPNPFLKPTPAFTGDIQASATTGANGLKKASEYVQPAWPKQAQATNSTPANTTTLTNQVNGKRKSGDDIQRRTKLSRKSPGSEKGNKQETSTEKGVPGNPRFNQDRDEFAKKIRNQLAKDKIKPPQWPENPGSFAQRQAIERFRETYKAYRERARKSLTRAGLIDDPDKKRRLDEALVFKGICEDMCPEWEQVTRIVEHDIRGPEKSRDENGDLVAMPSLMVKRLARSAAGQDAPLPMDVRSVRTLCRTLDYLIDLVSSDDLLPQRHSFLWDRTRAIRIDFSFQKYAMTPDEILDQIYCLETITRFHVTSLHLLSRDGFAPTDFSEQQEVEQLSKTLISLMEVYDDCAHQGIECKNEPEFRGYFIVFNAYNPALMERIEGWDVRFGNAEGIKSAIAIVQCIDNIRKMQGPLYPETYSQLAIDAISIFFKLIAHPAVSYTMACFAEIHFNNVRKGILKVIKRSFSRPRFGPKDLTPAVLKQCLHTDTEEEAVEFFKKHGIQFHEDGYAILSQNSEYIDARVRHSFSGDIVERKRSGRALPEVIRTTVFEENVIATTSSDESSEESLFVSDSQDVLPADSNRHGHENLDGYGRQAEDSQPTPPPSLLTTANPQTFGNHTITKPTTAVPPKQSLPPPPSNTIPVSQEASFTPVSTQTSGNSRTETAYTAPTGQQPSLFTQTGNSMTSSTTNTDNNAAATSSPWLQPTINGANKSPNNDGKNYDANSKVIFGNNVSVSQAAQPTTSISDPNFFGFLNSDKDLSIPPPKSLFANLGAKASDSSNKDGSQPPAPSGLSITPESVSKPLNPSKSISSALQPTTASLFSTFPPPTNGTPLGAPEASKQTSLTSQSSIFSQPASKPTSTSQQLFPTSVSAPQSIPQNDPMSDFTRWFVCADRGLMESHLQEFAVTHILKSIWDEFHAAEIERIQREEEERVNAKVRNFRENSLKLKYFWRWHDGFRKRQRIRRMNQEKEKARQWRLPENVAKRERAAREKQERIIQQTTDSMLRRSQHRVDETAQLRASTGPSLEWRGRERADTPTQLHAQSSSPVSQSRSIEEALLATGIFNGVTDERAAARYAARDYDPETQADLVQERKMRLRAENRSRIERGVHPLKELPEPKVYKEGSKTAMLRARCRGAGGDTLSTSTGSFRNSTFSSSYRSSVGYNNGRVSKSRSRVPDPYWTLKARGLVRMPNGEFLHESIALPMLREGKRIPGSFGDYGLPTAEEAPPSQSPPPELSSLSPPFIRADELGVSQISSSPSETRSQKRKRRANGSSPINGSESPANTKRAKSGDAKASSLTDADEHLADIANFLAMVEGRTSGRGSS
ncbi:SAC3/GANP/Nin1/mts3/eIF-3 p25 family-domain-containing protein [Daldinia vernicosa]|uniref:SAC3/GANP/Nin1/mts3/eIF-3 p25 family-domain-containing protein n=1 Tax=Daldinia vernicosa TaxID=114800 RepID=UPI002007972D|nr:SAC3/GANP/Nin1/mts3/eIF-3 p25 family-domain-containing protein [Daldinia vernicosa]KAI0851552.1 SAC3/GANP/Nin1/mts3/eIF-3 p25 family-domain-containing protein [Daldinia vernicosa]